MSPSWPQMAHSQRQLAAAVGRAVSTVNGWIKDPRWTFDRTPPWDVRLVKRWAEAALEPPDAELTPEERKARLFKIVQEVKLLDLRRRILTGELVRRDDAERAEITHAARFRDGMLALPRLVATNPRYDELPDEARAVLDVELTATVRDVLNALADGAPAEEPAA